MKNKIKIINTGGTFNKIYNPLNGNMEVAKNNHIIQEILSKLYKQNHTPKIKGILYKDSLDLTQKDRAKILKKIITTKADKIIVIHGTDTMDRTAKYINSSIQNKTVVFVGAMQPYSYEPVEASANLALAIGFLNNNPPKGIYICMNGLVLPYQKIKKNHTLGYFECL